jgi:hypothetical protein
MAARPTTEVTEKKRTSLNQAQGKKIQIVEYEWVPVLSVADADHIVLSDLPGVDSVLAVLSFQSWDGGALDGAIEGVDWNATCTKRPATGTTNAPTAGEDQLIIMRASTDSLDGVYFTVMIEST